MPFNIGPMELVILLVLVLVIFGVGRLPEVGGAIGKSIREFKKSTAGVDEDDPKDKDQIHKEQRT